MMLQSGRLRLYGKREDRGDSDGRVGLMGGEEVKEEGRFEKVKSPWCGFIQNITQYSWTDAAYRAPTDDNTVEDGRPLLRLADTETNRVVMLDFRHTCIKMSCSVFQWCLNSPTWVYWRGQQKDGQWGHVNNRNGYKDERKTRNKYEIIWVNKWLKWWETSQKCVLPLICCQ